MPKTMKALEPVDRAEEVPLAERHAAMAQNVVRRRDEEEKIRQGELLQVVVTFHLAVVAAALPGDDFVFSSVDLFARQRLHKTERGFDAALGGGEAGIVDCRQRGRCNAGETTAGVHGEIRGLTDLPGEAEHVRI